MTFSRWLLIGLPQVAIGAIWLYFGMEYETKGPESALMNSFGGVYIFTGLIVAVNKPWSRRVAQIAWYPLLLLFPIGTILGILALQLLRDDPVARKKFHEVMKSVSPEEVARIVREEAISRFGIRDDQFNIPLVESLKFAPVEVIGFMEDLEIDYGFRPASEISHSTASINDLIDAIEVQNEESNKASNSD